MTDIIHFDEVIDFSMQGQAAIEFSSFLILKIFKWKFKEKSDLKKFEIRLTAKRESKAFFPNFMYSRLVFFIETDSKFTKTFEKMVAMAT